MSPRYQGPPLGWPKDQVLYEYCGICMKAPCWSLVRRYRLEDRSKPRGRGVAVILDEMVEMMDIALEYNPLAEVQA